MPMLSDIAKITGDYLAGTQDSYNRARRDVIRAEMLRGVERDLLGAQRYLNPDLQEKTPQQLAAEELAAGGALFSAPQPNQSMAFQGSTTPAPVPTFSLPPAPSPGTAGYDGTVRPPKAPAFSAPTGLAATMTPLQDSLPPLDPRVQRILSGADAADKVEEMTKGKNVQGATVGGSNRTSGVDDETAAKIQEDYNARTKELSQLDRQDFLDKARLVLLKKMQPAYLERTAGLGGEDEWTNEVNRLEGSLTKRQQDREKILVKLQESDQKLLAGRSRAAAQNASLQLKKDVNDALARARLAAQSSKDRWEGMKIWQKMVQDHVRNALYKYQVDTDALGKNLPADIIAGVAGQKQYAQQALAQAVDRMNQNLSALRAGAFSDDPEALQKIMAETERDMANSTPTFDPTLPSVDPRAYRSFMGSELTPEGKAKMEQVGKLAGATSNWKAALGNDQPIVPGSFVPLIGKGPSQSVSFAFSGGIQPPLVIPAPRPAPSAGPRPSKIKPQQKKGWYKDPDGVMRKH